jgi:BadF/BadG/BcrA/BcrD ATPase family
MQIVGLDIGGSKTHAVSRHWTGTVEVFAGSANLASVGEVGAGRQLDAIFTQLAERGRIGAVCAGAAGVDTPEAEERLRQLIAARVRGATVQVVHDTELILAAAELTTGIALIAGTGSVAWGRDASGRVARAGGWGYLLGDEGSGYGIAREAVRHALRLADEGQPPDRLTQKFTAACTCNEQASSSIISTPIQNAATGPGTPGWYSSWRPLGTQPPGGSSTTQPRTSATWSGRCMWQSAGRRHRCPWCLAAESWSISRSCESPYGRLSLETG